VPDLVSPLAALLPQTVTPYVALMLAGFAVGILGHLAGSRWLVAAGIILIGLGAFLLPVVARIAA
jgi:biotin transporter BioY